MHGATGGTSDRPTVAFEIASRAYPFQQIERNGQVVGCWFTTLSQYGLELNGRPALRVFCRGAVRTADGRVAGVAESLLMHDDIATDMRHMLSRASDHVQTSRRRTAAADFVECIRHASVRIDPSWSTERQASALHEASLLSGYLDWDPAKDRAGTLAAMRTIKTERSALLRRFLDTLDPVLVGALRPHDWWATHTVQLDGMLGKNWPRLDESFGLGAPLREAILPFVDDWPQARQLLRRRLPRSRYPDGPRSRVGRGGRHGTRRSHPQDGGRRPDERRNAELPLRSGCLSPYTGRHEALPDGQIVRTSRCCNAERDLTVLRERPGGGVSV